MQTSCVPFCDHKSDVELLLAERGRERPGPSAVVLIWTTWQVTRVGEVSILVGFQGP